MKLTTKKPAELMNKIGKETLHGQALFALIQEQSWAKDATVVCSPKKQIKGLFLHPCVVDGCPTIIHAADLAKQSPEFFLELRFFAHQHNYQLLPERRSNDKLVGFERRTWLPVMLFTVGMNSAVVAKDLNGKTSQSLALFDATVTEQMISIEQPEVQVKSKQSSEVQQIEDETALHRMQITTDIDPWVDDNHDQMLVAELTEILKDHYKPGKGDPEFIESDLQEMAAYFSRYHQASQLIRDLKGHNWSLRFKPETFKTDIRGNHYKVHAARVYFDSRSAAQLKSHKSCGEKLGACVASPADALLHELLHAKAALVTPTIFIEQGGLNGVIYPFAHEHSVIQEENALYNAMSEVDGRMRPQRHRHAGRLAATSCVTCIQ